MKHIYFVRHGQTEANVSGYVSGIDESLSVNGFQQARECAERLRTVAFEKLYASDFLRSQQTAHEIAVVTGKSIEISALFGEIRPPTSLTGLHDTDPVVLEYRENRLKYVNDSTWKPEDGENLTDLCTRILSAKELLEEETSNSIVVVSHGIYLRFFLATILLDVHKTTEEWVRLAKRIELSNTGITLFEFSEENGWKLIMWNDHAHFAE